MTAKATIDSLDTVEVAARMAAFPGQQLGTVQRGVARDQVINAVTAGTITTAAQIAAAIKFMLAWNVI